MRGRRLLLALAAAYAGALIAFAPATLIDTALDRSTGGRLRLAAPEGGLWAGRGHLELRDPLVQAAVAKPVVWRLKPATLREGRIGFDVLARGAGQPFAVTFSWGRVELTAVRLILPAEALGLALPQLGALELTGTVSLDIASAVWEKGELTGAAAVRWRSAGSALSQISPLGSYELKLDCSRSVARVALSTLEGGLELTGSGAWTLGERPRLRASARVAPAYRRQLEPLLRLAGAEREPGRFELELK